MRNALVVITAFCVGSALVGCNSKSKPAPTPPPAPEIKKEPQVALNWTLALQSKCAEGVEATQCVAAHGFSVSKSGEYKVGPGPQGEIRTGTLAPEELQAVEAALTSTLSQPALRAESHEAIEAATSEDTITFVRGDAAPELFIKAAGTDLTFRTQSAEEAKSLLAKVREYAIKYYKTPFPDECNDGAAALQTLFGTMQNCTADSDCTFLDDTFEAVAPNSPQELVTDNCSIVKPLVVGNADAVRNSKTKLIESLDSVRAACGDNIIRNDCTTFTTFELTGAGPVCKQGVCKLSANQ